jgi:hypothetical protein
MVQSLFPAFWCGSVIISLPTIHRGASSGEFSSLEPGEALAESRESSFDI